MVVHGVHELKLFQKTQALYGPFRNVMCDTLRTISTADNAATAVSATPM
jgi:hypothetical protein